MLQHIHFIKNPEIAIFGLIMLRWFAHAQRQVTDEATRNILQMTVDEKENQGNPKPKWRDLVIEDMARNQMTTQMAEDRKQWNVIIQAGTH